MKTLNVGRADNQKYYEISWNGKDKSGDKVGSGIFMYKLKGKNYTSETKKMIMVK